MSYSKVVFDADGGVRLPSSAAAARTLREVSTCWRGEESKLNLHVHPTAPGRRAQLQECARSVTTTILPADSTGLSLPDFGTATIPADSSGRISPNGPAAALYDSDRAMHEQLDGSTQGGKGRFLSIESYSSWFDIDTSTVLERSWRTLYPKEDYIGIILNNQPDLYGPFWVPTTLIFALFLSSSLSSSIQAYLAGNTYNYDFTALSVAVTVVYVYALAVPVALWGVMRYWAGVDASGPIEIISVYGYSTTIWILSALLSIPPVMLLRLSFAALAFALSGFFLLRNIYPILSAAQSKAARVLILAVAFLHFVFAVLLWFYFLNAGGDLAKAPTGVPTSPPPVPGTGSGGPSAGLP